MKRLHSRHWLPHRLLLPSVFPWCSATARLPLKPSASMASTHVPVPPRRSLDTFGNTLAQLHAHHRNHRPAPLAIHFAGRGEVATQSEMPLVIHYHSTAAPYRPTHLPLESSASMTSTQVTKPMSPRTCTRTSSSTTLKAPGRTLRMMARQLSITWGEGVRMLYWFASRTWVVWYVVSGYLAHDGAPALHHLGGGSQDVLVCEQDVGSMVCG